MEIFGAIGGGAFVLFSLIVGVRLLLLAYRTRALPELAMGMGLFLIAGLGYPLMVLARFGEFLSEPSRLALLVAYQWAQIAGITCVAIFNWRVFRPDSRLARGAVVVVAMGMLGCFLAQLLGPGLRLFMYENAGPWALSSPFTILPLGWAGLESLRYHAAMRKREQLGLADPGVTNRFLLWALAALGASSMSAYSYAFYVMGVDVNATAEGPAVIGTLGLVSASSLWLAFLPPAAYRRWVQRSARVPA